MNLPKVQCKNGFWVVMGPVVEKWIKAGRIPYVIYQVAVEEPAFLSEEFNSFSAKLRVRNLSKINFSTLSCSYQHHHHHPRRVPQHPPPAGEAGPGQLYRWTRPFKTQIALTCNYGDHFILICLMEGLGATRSWPLCSSGGWWWTW